MFRPSLEQYLIYTRRSNLRRRMRVRHGPPDLYPIDAGLLLQLLGELIIDGWREQAEVGRNQIELRAAVVHCDDPVIDAVVHSGRLPRRIYEQPLRRRRRDVHLYHRSAEARGG